MASGQCRGVEMLNDQSASEEQDRSRWFWVLAVILLLLLLLGLIWIWWSGSKLPALPPATHAAVASASPGKAFDAPATSFDVPFGYHAFAVRPDEAAQVTSAVEAWRTYNKSQCGGACSCQSSARIDVVGHADRRTGTPAFNKCISWKRATVTADALVAQGVPRCDVAATFVGDSDISAPEADEQSAAAHRHASIAIVAGNAEQKAPCAGACRTSLSLAETQHCEALLKEPPLIRTN